MSPEERVARLEDRSPQAAELARLLSLAVRIEPELVRQARLLVPGADASAEADLWFSDLVAAQNPRGLVLDRDVAETLREQLAGDAERLDRAWSLVETFHREAPWSIRVEEKVNRLSVSKRPADRARIEDLLLAAAQEMIEAGDDKGPARWMVRGLDRLPRDVRGSESSRMLALGAGARLDGRLDLGDEELPPDAVESWFSWLFPKMKPVEIGVRLLDGAIEAGAIEAGDLVDEDVHRLRVPPTRPLLLDVRWHDGRRQRRERLEIPHGETRRLRVGAHAVELGTVLGERYLLKSSGAVDRADAGFDFSGVRAAHRPFYGRKKELEQIVSALRSETPSGRVVALYGAEGLGKTALFCRVLDRLEEDGVPTIVHFYYPVPDAWGDRETMVASLKAQCRRLLPDDRLPEKASLWDALEAVQAARRERPTQSSAAPELSRQPNVCLAVDCHPGGQDQPWELLPDLPTNLPQGIVLLWTSREQLLLRNHLQAETAITSIDLGALEDSNREVCDAYLAAHRDELGSLLSDSKQATAAESGPRIFISYTSVDEALQPLIQELVARLKMEGFEPWYDREKIVANQNVSETIHAALSESEGAIAFVTQAASSSDWVRREVSQLVTRQKRVLPVVGEGITNRELAEWFPGLEDRRFLQLQGDHRRTVQEIIEAVTAWGPNRRRDPLQVMLERAGGNIGRLKDMHRWIREQERVPVDLERMPPTLYGAMEDALDRLPSSYGRADVVRVLTLFAAAREPLPVEILIDLLAESVREPAATAGVPEILEAAGLVANLALQGAEPRIGLSDSSVRDWSVRYFDYERLTESHRLLAEGFPEDGWGRDDSPDGFRREYARRHQPYHLGWLEAWPRLHALLTDLDYLTEACAEEGVDAVEEELRVAAAAHPDDKRAGELGAVLRAVRAEATRLRESPGNLPSLLLGQLRAGGEQRRRAAEALRSARGRPYLALRHVLRPEASGTADLEPTSEPLKSLAFARGVLYAGAMSGRTYAWRFGTDKPVRTLADHKGTVTTLTAYKDGSLLSGSRDGTLRVWIDGELEHEVEGPGGAVLAARWLGGDHFAACAETGTVLLWDHGERTPLVGHTGPVTCCDALVHGGKGFLVTGAEDCTLRVWSVPPDGGWSRRFVGHSAPLTVCAAGSHQILSGDADGVLKVWSRTKNQLRSTLSGHRGAVTGCLQPAGSGPVVSSSVDGTVRVWKPSSGHELHRLEGHRGEVSGLAAVDKRRCVSFGRDGTVRLWHLERGKQLARFETRGGAVRAVAVVDEQIVAATEGGTVEVFPLDAATTRSDRSTCALNAAGDRILVASGAIWPVFWDTSSAEPFAELEAPGARLCAVNRGKDFYVTADREGRLAYWNAEGTPAASFEALTSDLLQTGVELTALAGARIGVAVAAGQSDGRVSAWWRRSGEQVPGVRLGFEGHEQAIRALAMDRDGSLLLSAADDGTLRLWSMKTGEPLATFRTRQATVTACDLSNDGRRALSGGVLGTLALWDVDTGRVVRELHGHRGEVTACAFGLAGAEDHAVSASADGTLKLWRLETGECLETFYTPTGVTDLDLSASTVSAVDAEGRAWILDSRFPESETLRDSKS